MPISTGNMPKGLAGHRAIAAQNAAHPVSQFAYGDAGKAAFGNAPRTPNVAAALAPRPPLPAGAAQVAPPAMAALQAASAPAQAEQGLADKVKAGGAAALALKNSTKVG
jgi:hypothetical protein